MKYNKVSPDKHKFLQGLTSIDNPPESLYYIGTLPKNRPKTIAIIGTRRPTAYGRAVTEQISSSLASHQVVIISGLALGIDAIAHRACLKAGGTTVAVVASGLDDPGPRSNRQIARDIIAQKGAIISERPVGYKIAGPWEFVIRNRIVSGLADAVIVTEANLRSGTMTTVASALDQGRDVYAVPGPITSPLSAGCNRLIAQGARPVCDIDSLVTELGLVKRTEKLHGQNDAEATLLQLLQDGVSDGEELQAMSSLDSQTFSATLTMLEIRGLIHSLGNNKWRL